MIRKLYQGDCLETMQGFDSESIDLCYIDPPFFSQKQYKLKDGTVAFKDKWDSRDQYLGFMKLRILEIYRLLKDTGSLYLHCDPTMSHYLKILMDIIFSEKNFRNEIVWHYRRYTALSNDFQRMHDIIFRYTKKKALTKLNTQYQPYQKTNIKNHPWEKDKKGSFFYWKKGKNIKPYKVYRNEKGTRMNDVWIIPQLSPISKERIDYPTQKPEALLERIIKASSNEGDVILDAFCGCGTTLAVAEKLNRQWIGIDSSEVAIKFCKERIGI